MAALPIRQVISSIYTKLNANATLTALLGTFNSKACIFTGGVPSKAPRPYIRIRFPKNPSDFSTKNTKGWTLEVEILAIVNNYTDHKSSSLLLDIVDEIVNTLHLEDLAITDNHLYTLWSASSSANTSDDLIGQQLTFNIQFTS